MKKRRTRTVPAWPAYDDHPALHRRPVAAVPTRVHVGSEVFTASTRPAVALAKGTGVAWRTRSGQLVVTKAAPAGANLVDPEDALADMLPGDLCTAVSGDFWDRVRPPLDAATAALDDPADLRVVNRAVRELVHARLARRVSYAVVSADRDECLEAGELRRRLDFADLDEGDLDEEALALYRRAKAAPLVTGHPPLEDVRIQADADRLSASLGMPPAVVRRALAHTEAAGLLVCTDGCIQAGPALLRSIFPGGGERR